MNTRMGTGVGGTGFAAACLAAALAAPPAMAQSLLGGRSWASASMKPINVSYGRPARAV